MEGNHIWQETGAVTSRTDAEETVNDAVLNIFSEKTVGAATIETLTRKTFQGRGKVVSALTDERPHTDIEPRKRVLHITCMYLHRNHNSLHPEQGAWRNDHGM